MRHLLGVCSLLAVVSFLPSCGGKSSTGPDKTPPAVVSVTITPADDFLLVGQTLQLAASVTLNDGTSRSGCDQGGVCAWGSDTPTVATIDATGKVTALTRGKVTVYVDIEGHRGTRLITVAPNFQGEWHGRFVLDKCSASGDFSTIGFCDDITAGDSDALTLTLTQSRSAMTGMLEFPSCPCSGSLNGSVGDDGAMTVTGSIMVQTALLTIKNWSTRTDQPGVMTGKFTVNWTAPGASGAANWDTHLSGVVRTAGGPAGLSVEGEAGPNQLFDRLRLALARVGR